MRHLLMLLVLITAARAPASETTVLASEPDVALPGPSDGDSTSPSISADGRFVAFTSLADDLVADDTIGSDVFVHDRRTRRTHRVSVSTTGGQANGPSWAACISANGRFVVFLSIASNLAPDALGGVPNVFLRDRVAGTTTLISIGSGGSPADGDCDHPWVTSDGRFVVFSSRADNLIAGLSGFTERVYLRDLVAGSIELVSVPASGDIGTGSAGRWPSVSEDGRYVVFASDSTTLVTPDLNGTGSDVFLRDRTAAATIRLNRQGDVDPATWQTADHPVISADGDVVAFEHVVPIPDPYDLVIDHEVDTWDVVAGASAVISSDPLIGSAIDPMPAISADARYVSFRALRSDSAGTPVRTEIRRYDRLAGTTSVVSVSLAGIPAAGVDPISAVAASADVAFSTDAALVPSDTNGVRDVYVHGPRLRIRFPHPRLGVWLERAVLPRDGTLIDTGLHIVVPDPTLHDVTVTVTQDEPTHQPPHAGEPDGLLLDGGGRSGPRLLLRGESAAHGAGRIYLVRIEAQGFDGEVVAAWRPVVVPRSWRPRDVLHAIWDGIRAAVAGRPLPYDTLAPGQPTSRG